MLARVKNRTPSTITLILTPDAEFNSSGTIAVTYPPITLNDYNGNAIVVSTRACAEMVKRGLGTEESVWYRTLLHELCHTLNVPAQGNHCWSGPSGKSSHHCTHPSCILYPSHDRRMTWANFWRLGRTYELCPECQREIRQAQAAAHGKLIETITPRQAVLDQIKATLALNPNRAEAVDFCGSAFAKLKDYPQAMAAYTKAIELNPNGANFYYHRGVLFTKQEQFKMALRDFDRAVSLDPRNASYHLSRGSTYYHIRAYAQAIDELRNACGLAYTARESQTYALAQNNLAWYLATCPDASCRNGNDAIELATLACKITAWEKSFYLGTLAAAYAEDHQYDRAVEYQTKVIAMESGRIKSLQQELLALYRAGKPYRETPEEAKKWRTEENSTSSSSSSQPID